jgi:hypothetical protein
MRDIRWPLVRMRPNGLIGGAADSRSCSTPSNPSWAAMRIADSGFLRSWASTPANSSL